MSEIERRTNVGWRRRRQAAVGIAIGLALSGIAVLPAHAAWTQFYSGPLGSSWKWSGHHTNSGGFTSLGVYGGTAFVMKSGSSTTYSGYNYVSVSWSSSYVSVACARTGGAGSVNSASCSTNR